MIEDPGGDPGKPFVLRLPRDIKARLRVDAARYDRSMTGHIAALIDEHTPPLDGERAAAAS